MNAEERARRLVGMYGSVNALDSSIKRPLINSITKLIVEARRDAIQECLDIANKNEYSPDPMTLADVAGEIADLLGPDSEGQEK